MPVRVFFDNQSDVDLTLNDHHSHEIGQINQNSQSTFTLHANAKYYLKGDHGSEQTSFRVGSGDIISCKLRSDLVNLQIGDLPKLVLPFTTSIGRNGGIWYGKDLATPVWSPDNTLLIIFDKHQSKPLRQVLVPSVRFSPTPTGVLWGGYSNDRP